MDDLVDKVLKVDRGPGSLYKKSVEIFNLLLEYPDKSWLKDWHKQNTNRSFTIAVYSSISRLNLNNFRKPSAQKLAAFIHPDQFLALLGGANTPKYPVSMAAIKIAVQIINKYPNFYSPTTKDIENLVYSLQNKGAKLIK